MKGTGLRVADQQPHISAANAAPELENTSKTDAGEEAGAGNPAPRKLIPYAGKEPRKPYKPRRPRAMISATKPDGTIPVTLGGKLPPVSVLARREFGLRALRR